MVLGRVTFSVLSEPEAGLSGLDSYQLSFVQEAQEIFYNVLKASDRKGFRRMNDDSAF